MKSFINQNKVVITMWIIISVSLSILFSFINKVTLITSGISSHNEVVNISYGYEICNLSLESANRFEISLPIFEYTKLSIDKNITSDIKLPMQIDTIEISNVLGSKFVRKDIGKVTNLREIIKLSPLLLVNINNQNQTSNPIKLAIYTYIFIFALVLVLMSVFMFIYRVILVHGSLLLVRVINNTLTGKEYKIINKLMMVSCIIVLIVAYWSSFVGITYNDEGFFDIMAKNPIDVGASSTMFFIFSSKLYNIVHGNLILFRQLTFVINIICIFVLYFVVENILEIIGNTKYLLNERIYLFLFILISSYFQFIHHLSPDYNNLSRSILFLQVALFLMLFYRDFSLRILCLLGIAIGFIGAFNFFIKFPTFVFSSFVFIIGFYLSINRNKFWYLFLSFCFGIVLSFGFYFIVFQSFADFKNIFKSGFLYSSLVGSHSVGVLILGNMKDVIQLICKLLVCFAIYRYSSYKLQIFGKVRILFGVCSVLFIVLVHSLFTLGSLTDYFIWMSVGLCFIVLIITYENLKIQKQLQVIVKKSHARVHIMCGLLFMLLYSASAGTQTPILYHVMFNITLLFIVILFEWQLVSTKKIDLFLINIITLFCSIIIIKGLFFNNTQYSNLLTQTIYYQIDDQSGVYLDSPTFNDLNKIKQILSGCGYNKQNYVIGLYSIPQIVYAVDARAPIITWTTRGDTVEQTIRANAMILNALKYDKYFVIIDDRISGDILKLKNIANLQYCGSVSLSGINMFDSQHFSFYRKSSLY